MKRIISLLMAIITLSVCMASCQSGPVQYEDIDFGQVDMEKVKESDKETDYVIITIENMGKIVVRLYPDVAPETVKNFKKLVSEKFYDGIIFHRVIKNFMIQGGDPEGTGFGGSDEKIFGEFTSNGFENNLKHTRGVVSMARRSDDNNSASSQFFICHGDYEYGDGDYAAFGYVVAGMDVVDAIATTPTNPYNNRPLTPVIIESIRFAKVGK